MNTHYVCEFVEFAKTLNYAQTAKCLFISPTALTKHVHDLERDIGMALVASSGTVATLTPAGRVFAQEAPVSWDWRKRCWHAAPKRTAPR